MDASAAARRRGFTLVELLVVIVIIGILAGLVTAAVFRAQTTARQAAIAMEIKGLEEALNRYKEKFGEYPPDFSGVNDGSSGDSPAEIAARNAVLRHLRRAFHRYQPADFATFASHVSTATNGKLDVYNVSPASALVFWLGGIPEGRAETDGTLTLTGFSGFSADPANPFQAGGQRTPAFFDFNVERVRINYDTGSPKAATSWCFLCPSAGSAGSSSPYVYFRSRPGGYYRDWGTGVAPYFDPNRNASGAPSAYPLGDGSHTDAQLSAVGWYNKETFQIISAGMDGLYGASSPAGSAACYHGSTALPENISAEHYDNLTNFLTGTIEDAKETLD